MLTLLTPCRPKLTAVLQTLASKTIQTKGLKLAFCM